MLRMKFSPRWISLFVGLFITPTAPAIQALRVNERAEEWGDYSGTKYLRLCRPVPRDKMRKGRERERERDREGERGRLAASRSGGLDTPQTKLANEQDIAMAL